MYEILKQADPGIPGKPGTQLDRIIGPMHAKNINFLEGSGVRKPVARSLRK